MKPVAAATLDKVHETLQTLAAGHRVTLAVLPRLWRLPLGYLARSAGSARQINFQRTIIRCRRSSPGSTRACPANGMGDKC